MGLTQKNQVKNTLSENAVLVRLTVKFWSGIKTDKRLRENLAVDVKAKQESLNVTKHLVRRYNHETGKSIDTNKYFRRIVNKVRNDFYYPLTLPWDDNSHDIDDKVVSGWRLCPNSQLETLQKGLDQAKIEFYKEVDAFVKDYPQLIEEAKDNLGEAFNENDYPLPQEIKRKFKFESEISTIPTFGSDIRLNVSENLRRKIEHDAEKRITNNVASVFKTTVSALVEQSEHLAEKLKSYNPEQKGSGFFKNSSFDKLKQTLSVLPSFNEDILGNDKNIREAHQDLVKILATVQSVDKLRENSEESQSQREDVANNLSEVTDTLKNNLFNKLRGND